MRPHFGPPHVHFHWRTVINRYPCEDHSASAFPFIFLLTLHPSQMYLYPDNERYRSKDFRHRMTTPKTMSWHASEMPRQPERGESGERASEVADKLHRLSTCHWSGCLQADQRENRDACLSREEGAVLRGLPPILKPATLTKTKQPTKAVFTMSRSTLSVHDEYEKQGDVEKNPPDLVEDFEGLETIQRTPTTPPALITELDKGLIAWESQQDPENPLSVSPATLFGVSSS